MKIYTKTGDKGETSLFNGRRVSKDHELVSLFGLLDELNSIVGALQAHLNLENVSFEEEKKQLIKFQRRIFSIGSYYASEKEGLAYIKNIESWTTALELEMDRLTKMLPDLKHFILPGGSKSSSFAHLARVHARKVERDMVTLENVLADDSEGSSGGSLKGSVEKTLDKNKGVDSYKVIVFMNRASDYFFTLARYINLKLDEKELIWVADED